MAINEKLGVLRADVAAVKKELLGNGQAGLVQRVDTLEAAGNRRTGAYSVLAGFGGLLWAGLEYYFHLFKAKH